MSMRVIVIQKVVRRIPTSDRFGDEGDSTDLTKVLQACRNGIQTFSACWSVACTVHGSTVKSPHLRFFSLINIVTTNTDSSTTTNHMFVVYSISTFRSVRPSTDRTPHQRHTHITDAMSTPTALISAQPVHETDRVQQSTTSCSTASRCSPGMIHCAPCVYKGARPSPTPA